MPPATEPANAPAEAPNHSSANSNSDAGLHRGLGVGGIVFMVVAAAAPMGVVAANLPIVIAVSGNAGAPVYFIVAMIVLLLFAVGFTLMSRHVRNAGAFYSYVQAGLGRIPGVGAATLALGSYVVLLVGVTAYLGAAVSNAIDRYTGAVTPWWLWASLALGLVGVLGYRDIELSSKVLGVLLVAETLVIVVLDVGIVVHGGRAGLNLEPFAPAVFDSGAPGLGIMFALFGFIGFEATAVFRNEAKNPDRTIPRATYLALVSIGVFYAFSSWAVVMGTGTAGAVDAASRDPQNMVFDLALRYVGPLTRDVMSVLLVTSTLACVLSFHNVIARYQFTLGRAGVLPGSVGQVNAVHGAPSRSSLVVTVVTLVCLGVVAAARLDPVRQAYTWLSGAATLGIVALMALTCLAVLVFFRATHDERGTWRTVIAPGLGLLGLCVVLVLTLVNFPDLVGGTTEAIVVALLVAAMFLAGTVVALVLRARRPAVYRNLLEPAAIPAGRPTPDPEQEQM
jgi:amino acid transporter